MRPYKGYSLWTTGTYDVTATIGLDWRKTYLINGGITLTDGDDYAHVYIAKICSYHGGDVVRCGIRDIGGDKDLGLQEFISGARDVTVKLRTKGGRHRAEVMVYELP
jgi:hypothetical protein